jgi:hypothetical protein
MPETDTTTPGTLTPTQLHRTFQTMQRHGGNFATALATAWFAADPHHKRLIEANFGHFVNAYGPRSRFYPEDAS